MPRFMSEEWLKLYQEAVNNNKAYAQAASWWTGDFIFIARAIGDFKEDAFVFIGLSHGKCTGVKSISTENEYEVVKPGESPISKDKIPVEYVYEANYETWMKILDETLDPIRALLSGQAKVIGDMAKILKATAAAKELVRSATMVETEFN